MQAENWADGGSVLGHKSSVFSALKLELDRPPLKAHVLGKLFGPVENSLIFPFSVLSERREILRTILGKMLKEYFSFGDGGVGRWTMPHAKSTVQMAHVFHFLPRFHLFSPTRSYA